MTEKMKIRVNDGGKCIATLEDVDSGATIETLKGKVKDEKGITAHALKFEGTVMEGKLSNYPGITSGSTIELVRTESAVKGAATQSVNETPAESGIHGVTLAPLKTAKDYLTIKSYLEDLINTYESSRGGLFTGQHKVNDAKVDEQFFRDAHLSIVQKDRDDVHQKWLVSEQDTSHENFDTEVTTNFTFNSCYESGSSLSLATSKGWTIGVGGNAGAGFSGATVGASTGVQFSKSKTMGEGQSLTQTKNLTVEIPVPPGKAVIVKELLYRTVQSAKCVVRLTVESTAMISYTIHDRDDTESIEIKRLEKVQREKIDPEKQWIKFEAENVVTIDFIGQLQYKFDERKLETWIVDSDKERFERVQKAYQ